MASIGMNVAADGRHTPESIAALHCTWVRLVARQEHDLSDYLASLQAVGIRVLLVFDRTSVEQFGTPATAFEFYDHHYGLLVDAFEVGNEPDDLESPSSWTMTPAEFTALGHVARQTCPTRLLVTGGLVSGQPSWLVGQDIGWCDAIAIHPYLRDAPSPSDLEDLPDVDVLATDYAMLGKQIWVTEWGWWGDDEQRGATEIDDMIGWAARTSSVGVFFYFCADDAMVAPFGLYHADGTPKWAASRFTAQAGRAVPVPLPTRDPPAPIPEPDPLPPVVPASPDAALDEAYRRLWTAVSPVAYEPSFAIPSYWREHASELGSPIGGEIDAGNGQTYQTFANGILTYAPGTGVSRVV